MKTASIILCLACAAAWAQNAPSLQLPTPDPVARSNRAEIIRRALAARTNAAAASALTNPASGARRSTLPGAIGGAPTTVAPATGAATPETVTAPQPGAGPAGAIPSPAGAGAATAVQPGEIAITPTASASTNTPEAVVPAGMIDFRLQDLPVVLQFYAELVNRTVLRPANLPATQITLKSQTDLTVREAVQALDAVLALNQITMINVGDKFVKAVPQAQAFMEGAAFSRLKPDELPELGKFVTHVVQLKYARPSEMVQVLQPLAKIPNSILPIDSSMMLVLRDYSENVKRMLEMIKEVDVSIPSEFISEVIPIKYALSSDIANALNSLGSGGGGTTVGGSSTGTAGTMGGRSSFGGRSGTSGMGSRGGMMGYPGSTMQGMNPMGTTTQAGATPGAPGSFTDRLRNIINRASVSGNIEVIGETKIIADERTNSLLVFATREDMKIIKDIVSKLDVVLAQVLIEAVIIEVQLGPNTKDFGISYLQHPKTAGDVTGVGAIGSPFLRPGDFVAGGGGTNGGSGAGLSGGFNYLASFGQDLDVTLTAIASETRAKVLQRPRIQTSHAVQAQLFVGESRPYPTASQYGGVYGSYSSIQQLQIGVTLDVTPLINPDGLVVMDIHQTIENYAGFTEITGVGQVPNTTRKEAAAKVAVRDRDTIMLGGLIETDKSRNGSGVPFLMNIPILGYLFRNTQSSETRKELIVLIRPTVLPTPEVAALTAQSEKERMPGVRRAEAEFQAREEKELLKAEEELRKMEDSRGRKRKGTSWLEE